MIIDFWKGVRVCVSLIDGIVARMDLGERGEKSDKCRSVHSIVQEDDPSNDENDPNRYA